MLMWHEGWFQGRFIANAYSIKPSELKFIHEKAAFVAEKLDKNNKPNWDAEKIDENPSNCYFVWNFYFASVTTRTIKIFARSSSVTVESCSKLKFRGNVKRLPKPAELLSECDSICTAGDGTIHSRDHGKQRPFVRWFQASWLERLT